MALASPEILGNRDKSVQWSIKEERIDEKVEAADKDNSFKDSLKREGRNGSVGGMNRQGFKLFSFKIDNVQACFYTGWEYKVSLMGRNSISGKKILAETKSL